MCILHSLQAFVFAMKLGFCLNIIDPEGKMNTTRINKRARVSDYFPSLYCLSAQRAHSVVLKSFCPSIVNIVLFLQAELSSVITTCSLSFALSLIQTTTFCSVKVGWYLPCQLQGQGPHDGSHSAVLAAEAGLNDMVVQTAESPLYYVFHC